MVLWFEELCGNCLRLAHEFLAGASLNPRISALTFLAGGQHDKAS